jgi:hypothetical protein
MIKQIDLYRTSLGLSVLFIISLGITAYQVYDLQAENTTMLWLFLSITSLAGGIALVLSLRVKREIIVFKEKNNSTSIENTTDHSVDTIQVDLVEIKKIAQLGGKEVMLNGLKAICKQLEAGQGALYLVKEQDGISWIELTGGYALTTGENTAVKFDLGEGLIGQCAATGQTLYIDEIPEGYMKVVSGLGMASPRYLLIVPAKKEDKTIGVLEVSAFKALGERQRKFVEEAAHLLGAKA